MIINPGDITDLGLSYDDAIAAIAEAQAIAEGPLGANRSLEKQSFTEVLNLSSSGIVYLSRLPIDQSIVPQVKIRYGEYRLFDTSFSNQQWITVPPTNWEIDYELGEVFVRTFSVVGMNLYSASGVTTKRRPTQPSSRSQIQITYTSGLDFVDENNDAIAIKSTLMAMVRSRQSPMFAGVSAVQVDDHYKVNYGLTSNPNANGMSAMDEYLSIFRKYRPRSI